MAEDPKKDGPKDPKNAALSARRKEDPDKKAHDDCRDNVNAPHKVHPSDQSHV